MQKLTKYFLVLFISIQITNGQEIDQEIFSAFSLGVSNTLTSSSTANRDHEIAELILNAIELKKSQSKKIINIGQFHFVKELSNLIRECEEQYSINIDNLKWFSLKR